jgi:hypothetical protein
MVLVSIVGDFYSSVLPLFYEYKDKISEHIIIHDDFKNDEISARKIINGTCRFIDKSNLDIKSFVIKLDEDSYKAIEKVADMLRNHISSSDELLLNVTDGLANVGIVLSNIFMPEGAQILTYDRYDNEYNILTSKSMKTFKIQTSIPIKDHLLLKDIEVESIQDISFAQKNEKALSIFFERYEADRELYKKSKDFSPAIGSMPTGFLYEYYIYNLIKELAFDDILMGVKIKDNRKDDHYLSNEYDILIMKDNHLHMIECKYLKILSVGDLVYKLDSVRESLDEDANIMIVTDFDTYNETEGLSNTLMNPTYKRAFAKKIYLRGSPRNMQKRFLKDVDNAFSLQTKDIDTIVEIKKFYHSIKESQRKKMKQSINDFLTAKFHYKIDYFQKEELVKILTYKTFKKATPQMKKAMQKENIHEFVSLINKMLTSKKEYISIYDVYAYYETNLKTK